MAVPGSAIFALLTGGSDTANGGGFDPGNANFPTDGAVSSANTATPTISSASYTFVSGDIGARVFIKSGTNSTPCWAEITAVNAGVATLDCAIGHCPLYVAPFFERLNTVVGCGTAASLSSITFGVDYSLQNSPRTAITAGTAAGSGSTITDSSIGKNWVGNAIQMTGGTNVTTGTFFVTSTSTTTATLDRAVTTGATSNAAGGMGGAKASPGLVAGLLVTNNGVIHKQGTYTLTSSSANVAGGRVAIGVAQVKWIGFANYPGDNGTKPIIHAGAITGITVFGINAFCCHIENVEVNGNSGASNIGFGTSSGWGSTLQFTLARNCPNRHYELNNRNLAIGIRAEGGSGIGVLTANDGTLYACYIKSVTNTGFYQRHGNSAYFCIAHACTVGFLSEADAPALVVHGTAYKCTSHGFSNGEGTDPLAGVNWINCASISNTGRGFHGGVAMSMRAINPVTYNNTAGASLNVHMVNATALSGDPFVDGDNGDFRLNNTAGAGALMRATASAQVAWPTIWPGLANSLNFADLGTVQAAPAAPGGAQLIGVGGGLIGVGR
jgi:hypothetical protein